MARQCSRAARGADAAGWSVYVRRRGRRCVAGPIRRLPPGVAAIGLGAPSPPRVGLRIVTCVSDRARPNAGKGRLQRQIARAFIAHGPVLTSSDVYRWCKRWQAREFGQWERWSIVRILDVVADRVGRGTGRGWPWLWRLKSGYFIRPVRLKSLMK